MGTMCVLVSFPFLFMPPIGLSIKECEVNNIASNQTTTGATTVSSTMITSEPDCEGEGEQAVTAYYSAFVVLFQFGWATVQISHLSMIPDITSCENTRMTLTSVRYAATVMSNIFVYCITWILLDTGQYMFHCYNTTRHFLLKCQCVFRDGWISYFRNTGGSDSNDINPDDSDTFRNAMLISIGVGGLSSLVFHLVVKAADKSVKKVFKTI